MVTDSMSTFVYRLLGHVVHSELELPELQRGEPGFADPAILIRYGHADALASRGRSTETPYVVDRAGFLLEKPGVARYGIADGRTITVDVCDGASAFDVRAFLLGSVFGALCHQRGLLPLHAGAVASGGSCVAFAGRSGTGKSTLTSGLLQRGFTFVTDDICPIDVAAGGTPTVLPGVPRLKLAADSMKALGRDSSGWVSGQDQPPKYHLDVHSEVFESATLTGIYMFTHEEANPAPYSLREITPKQAVPCVEQLTYMPRYPRAAGLAARHFRHCVQVADRVPMFLVHRRRDLAHLSRFVDAIAEHILANSGSRGTDDSRSTPARVR